MSPRQPQPAEVSYQLPPLTPLVRNVLIVLFVLYAVELAARNLLHLPVDALTWRGFGEGFALWQPLTRYLVQGQGVLGIVLAGVAVYFLLPALERWSTPWRIAEALAVAALGGTLLALGLDAAGLLGGVTSGWPVLVATLVVLFGLYQPNANILLFFVLPIPARLLVWGTGILAGLLLLATLDLRSADFFGTFLGTLAWWRWRGPNARRRQLAREGAAIERELRRFQVLEGGRKGNRKKDDDEWVH
jgi:hypothetical protein